MDKARTLRLINPNIVFTSFMLFLIVSSSTYPMIISQQQNEEMTLIGQAVTQFQDSAYIVWQGLSEIFYKRNTVSFDPTTDLSGNGGRSPALAASGNNVYVVWADEPLGNGEILYRRSTDGGANFGSTVNLSNDAGNSFHPAVAAYSNLPI